MSNGRTRRHFSAEQKAGIVRRHLSDKVPVSALADEFGVQPTLIHLWVKQVLDQAGGVVGTTIVPSNRPFPDSLRAAKNPYFGILLQQHALRRFVARFCIPRNAMQRISRVWAAGSLGPPGSPKLGREESVERGALR